MVRSRNRGEPERAGAGAGAGAELGPSPARSHASSDGGLTPLPPALSGWGEIEHCIICRQGAEVGVATIAEIRARRAAAEHPQTDNEGTRFAAWSEQDWHGRRSAGDRCDHGGRPVSSLTVCLTAPLSATETGWVAAQGARCSELRCSSVSSPNCCCRLQRLNQAIQAACAEATAQAETVALAEAAAGRAERELRRENARLHRQLTAVRGQYRRLEGFVSELEQLAAAADGTHKGRDSGPPEFYAERGLVRYRRPPVLVRLQPVQQHQVSFNTGGQTRCTSAPATADQVAALLRCRLTVRGLPVTLHDESDAAHVLLLTGVPHYVGDAGVLAVAAAFGTPRGLPERRVYRGVATGERLVRLRLNDGTSNRLPPGLTLAGLRLTLRLLPIDQLDSLPTNGSLVYQSPDGRDAARAGRRETAEWTVRAASPGLSARLERRPRPGLRELDMSLEQLSSGSSGRSDAGETGDSVSPQDGSELPWCGCWGNGCF
ncbi:hypothetical protein FJT64_026473 [Amphibalanus amphitrite]|uniref:Uncharacterized protein n=1 Tax=Amphibalanus amphitrite TaxID=1232801 RepID=A0A6A4W1N0_AMPAM|nr:hypothetical protein FJT64_026473 [Amphibalanus amphitrite]